MTRSASAQAGLPDSTFGTNGVVTHPAGMMLFNSGEALVLQDDGGVVVAGTGRNRYTSFRRIGIARFTATGQIDDAFGIEGRTTADFGQSAGAHALATQSTGAIVVAGFTEDLPTEVRSFALARFTHTGRLDSTFGTEGRVVTAIGASSAEAWGLAVQDDDRIVAAGAAAGGTEGTFALARYLPDGGLDASFGDAGIAAVEFGQGFDGARGVAIQQDSRIVAVGYGRDGGPATVAVARLLPTGQPDSTFAGDGTLLLALGGTADAYHVVVQPDARILVGGYVTVGGGRRVLLVRLESNGSLDSTFGNAGVAVTEFAGGSWAHSLALYPDGRIAVGGTSQFGFDGILGRFMPDGSLDASFGTGGRLLSIGMDAARGVAVDPTGRIVYAGSAGFLREFLAAGRRLQTGPADPSFRSTGIASTRAFGPGDVSAAAMAVQSDGRSLLTACTQTQRGSAILVARLTTDGDLDESFGGGIVVTEIGSTACPDDLAIDAEGRVVVVGSARLGTRDAFAVVRYLPNGELDASFGGAGHVLLRPATADRASANTLAIQSDGRIVVGGYVPGSALVRILADGSIDPTFGSGGWSAPTYGLVEDLTLDSGGRLLATGTRTDGAKGPSSGFVARWLSNGTSDSSFGVDGVAHLSVGSGEHAVALALQGDGRIVVGGHVGNNWLSVYDIAVLRFTQDGAHDLTYANGGLLYPLGLAGNSMLTDLAIDDEGRVVATGTAMVRIRPDGTLDPSFGRDGVADPLIWPTAIAVVPDGRILAMGSLLLTEGLHIAAARYQGDEPVATEPPTPAIALALAVAPNPMRGMVRVSYAIPSGGIARLALYDALGREVALLNEGERAAGRHAAGLDAQALAPGVYLLRLETGTTAITQRVSVVR